ncbi:DUF4129 domain-containing protein [bacterium]|nr:DUF4129 domain-containing protein [bacterium]
MMLTCLSRIIAIVSVLVIASTLQAQNWGDEDFFETRQLDQPVEQGQKALARLPQANWYNSESGEVQKVSIPGETQMPASQPGAPTPPKKTTTTPTGSWFPAMSWMSSVVMYSILVLVLVVICSLIFMSINSLGKSTTKPTTDKLSIDDEAQQIDRVEQLPFEVKKKDGNLLDEARLCYDSGNFNEAIVYLFSFQLVELDKGHAIRLSKGKTNGQYLRELRQHRDLRKIVQLTMNAFEDVFFGNRNLTRDQFEKCWKQLSQFEGLLAGGPV